MNEEKWFMVAVFLILIGALLMGIHFISEAKECASKGGYYMTPSGSWPVCLKAEVVK